MIFIDLDLADGRVASINPAQIAYIEDRDGFAVLVMVGGEALRTSVTAKELEDGKVLPAWMRLRRGIQAAVDQAQAQRLARQQVREQLRESLEIPGLFGPGGAQG